MKEDRCVVCGGSEELKKRKIAHDSKIVCRFCWDKHSLAEIISEADIK